MFSAGVCGIRQWASRGARALLIMLLVGVVVVPAAQGQALAEGPVRWQKPALTVHVADEAAWAQTDVAASLAGWSAVLPMTLTDDPGADIVLASGAAEHEAVGATAYAHAEGSRILSCRVDLAPRMVGRDATGILPHELGHCLGIGDDEFPTKGPSVMYWIEGAPQYSATPTAEDLSFLRAMYR